MWGERRGWQPFDPLTADADVILKESSGEGTMRRKGCHEESSSPARLRGDGRFTRRSSGERGVYFSGLRRANLARSTSHSGT